MREFKFWNNTFGWAVFAIATISYLMTMEPTTSLWDCSEFIATSYKLEVGHPPGAPLFMMLARLAAMLAPSPEYVPMMINGLNSVASGFCILFLFWTITHLARRILWREGEQMGLHKMVLILGAGAIGALSYAYTDTFWFSAVEGEVYALSSMFTALVVWLMLRWEENAASPTSMRWIVLIAYLMGLSIGVHILNLLTIPALVMIYFFRKYEFNKPMDYVVKIGLALFVSLLILGAINGVIIPYTVALGASFDTFAVNTLGLPVNVGMIAFVVLLFAALGGLILFSHKRRMRALNIVLVSLTVILIGFSSYASVTIRAVANPPMNSNNPSTPHSLLSMLNRDQYGKRPLLRGPYYSAMPLPLTSVSDDVYADDYYIPTGNYESKTMMWLNPDTGKYEAREMFDNYRYPSEANHFMPRMWNYLRRADYEAGWVTMENGSPAVVASSADGDYWREPTLFDDVRYFFGYQMGDMFWRYFMWNFVGRQDDIMLEKDDNGIYMHGGWLSGISFIDSLFCGAQSNLPSEARNNPARNTYFLLPLLLGLLGLVYQFGRDWRNFFVVLLLFVMMGIALVVYFNTAPNEPRERDYVYAGAFYAFSIWVGLGVLAIGDMLESFAARYARRTPSALTASAVVALLLTLSVPAVLAVENWDDHDRSGRYMARDIGRNYLNTVPHNAIIINYGDNDTFPLWYCQEVENIRPDVRVMNSSYLGGEWYIDEMKLAANESDGVPFTIPSTKYSFVNDWVLVVNPVEVLDTQLARTLRAEKRRIDNTTIYNIEVVGANGEPKYVVGGYSTIYKKLNDCQNIISRYDPILQDYMASGKAPAGVDIYDVYGQYTEAYDVVEAILGDERFLNDYDLVEQYWMLCDRATAGHLELADAIRLFTSEVPMTLVINDGRMRLLEEGEVIPEEERMSDYDMIGRLMPKVDSYLDGLLSDYILEARTYVVPVDVDAAVEAGIIADDERDLCDDYVEVTLDKSLINKDHLMMLDLLSSFGWKRPLSFTQTHIMKDYGIINYARFDGYSYALVPICTPQQRGGEVGYVDIDKLYPLFAGEEGSDVALHYGNIADENVYADYFIRFNVTASRSRENFARLAAGFIRRNGDGDLQRAEKLLDRGLEVLPAKQLNYTHTSIEPYIRGYYTIANGYMSRATVYLEDAVNKFKAMTSSDMNIEWGGDSFAYFYDLSEAAQELQVAARRMGCNTTDADRLLALSDEAFAAAELAFNKGDKLAAEYISVRGEWVAYYLQYATYSSFTPKVSSELYNAMLDIIEVLILSHEQAGSFDWVAGVDSDHLLVNNALIFDQLVAHYLKAIQRLTPASADDPAMAMVESHIYNLFEIYSSLPSVRYTAAGESDAIFIKDLVEFLERPDIYDMLVTYYK